MTQTEAELILKEMDVYFGTDTHIVAWDREGLRYPGAFNVSCNKDMLEDNFEVLHDWLLEHGMDSVHLLQTGSLLLINWPEEMRREHPNIFRKKYWEVSNGI